MIPIAAPPIFFFLRGFPATGPMAEEESELKKEVKDEEKEDLEEPAAGVWMFPKIVGFSPQIIHGLIGFSMKKTIHLGAPLFLETPVSIV